MIERKYLDMLQRLSAATRRRIRAAAGLAASAARRPARRPRRSSPRLPAGPSFRARRSMPRRRRDRVAIAAERRRRRSGADAAAPTGGAQSRRRRRAGASATADRRVQGRGRRSSGPRLAPRDEHRRPAVHQVLATLGYGDAIGHEVLGIQRVLRAAGYESDIFVETADPRLESLTRDYRELVDASHPDNLLLHHFSIGSKASRTAYALPDRMALIYHNITPPEYFAAVHRTLARAVLPRPARDSRLRRSLRPGARRLRVQPPGARVARLPANRRAAGRARLLTHLDDPADWFVAQQFDDEWTNMLFVGRVIANKKIEDVIRCFHAYHTAFNPRSRLIIVGVFSVLRTLFRGADAPGRTTRRSSTCTSSATSPTPS